MERGISVRPTEITGRVKVDHLQNWSRIFWSDQIGMVRFIWCTNRNLRNFGSNGKRPWFSLTRPILKRKCSLFLSQNGKDPVLPECSSGKGRRLAGKAESANMHMLTEEEINSGQEYERTKYFTAPPPHSANPLHYRRNVFPLPLVSLASFHNQSN